MLFYSIDKQGILQYDMRIAEEADPDFVERLRHDDTVVEIPSYLVHQVGTGWKYYKDTDEFEPPEPEVELTSSMIIDLIRKGVNQV